MKKTLVYAALVAFLVATGCAGQEPPLEQELGQETPIGQDQVVPPAVVGVFADAVTGALTYPTGIAIAADGIIFTSDVKANRVVGTTTDGEFIEITNLDQPLGIAVAGNLVYVGSRGRKTVEVYDLATRKHAFNLQGSFEMPNGIAVAADGTIFVADSKANTVTTFASDGSPTGALVGDFRFPVAVAVDAERVVVGDQGNHRVVVFPRDGGDAISYGETLPAETTSVDGFKGRFTRVQGVALVGDDIYVLDSYHSHVQVLDRDGDSKGFLGSAGSCDSCLALGLGIAFDSTTDGVVVTDPENQRWITLSMGGLE